MPSPTFTNDYAKDGKALRAATRAEAGHRCIRCGHPYETGHKRPDAGEWSDCDEKCTHRGIIRTFYKGAWSEPYEAAGPVGGVTGGQPIQARWRILTVHHFDGNKANDRWWNHLALCQVCHLSFQSRVNPEIPYMFEHSDWLKPYVAGFYALKYEGKDLTREQVMERLEELLKYENRLA